MPARYQISQDATGQYEGYIALLVSDGNLSWVDDNPIVFFETKSAALKYLNDHLEKALKGEINDTNRTD